jgi:hypothetical protein
MLARRDRRDPPARTACRQYRATTIVRYVDRQGRPLKQIEVSNII